MAEEDEETTEEGGEEEGKKKKGGMMMIIIIVVVLLLLGGGGAAFFLLSGGDEEGDEDADVMIKYETVELRPFIVNLNDNVSYLKVRILLEYDPTLVMGGGGGMMGGGGSPLDPLSGDLPGSLQDREAMIRDSIITILTAKSRQEVLSAEGKEALKEELLEAINDATGLDEAPIVGIYFIEFVIQ